MKSNYPILLVAVFFCACCTFTSCARHHHPGSPAAVKRGKGNGPPPHAPAHGYRHKHQDGLELVYDSKLGVYVVIGFPDHYFCNGHYFRLAGENWEISSRITGPWTGAKNDLLPPGLKVKGGRKAKGKQKVKIHKK